MNGISIHKSTFRSLTCYLISLNQFNALFTFSLKQTIHISLDKHSNNRQ